MAVKAELFIRETLQRLDPDDPERSFLEKQLKEFGDFNKNQALLRGSEDLLLRDSFTPEEKKALKEDGVVFYTLTGTTISEQREARNKAGKPSFWHVADAGDRLLAVPSRRIEVGIYPDPQKFFVPGSFYKTTDQQDVLMEQDAENLRKRLGLKDIGMARPEASEATEVIFTHFDETQIRLLGQDYREQASGYYPYIRTSTPTNKSGSSLALVGGFDADGGLSVNVWPRGNRDVGIGLARWVVPQRSR